MKQLIQNVHYSTSCESGLSERLVLILAMLAVLVISSSSLLADESDRAATRLAYYNSHQAGVRLGGWFSLGDSPADSVGEENSPSHYLTDFNSGSFYLEGYFSYRFNTTLMGEISGGVVSRGDVTLVDEELENSYYGSMLVYPILAKLRFYPGQLFASSLHPYLTIGGGVYYGRHDVQVITSGSNLYRFVEEDSKAKLGYVVGGGFDWPVASRIAFDLNVQYMPIKFSSDLIGIRDYSSTTVTVGVKYLFKSDRDSSKSQMRR